MSVNKISKTTNAVKSAILRKSVRTLPNNPSAKGYKAEEIKMAMYEFVTGDSNSVMNEQDRIVDEINGMVDEINDSLLERDSNLTIHASREDNPHAVTPTQIGLGNVNNTSDIDKPISNATQQELNKKVGKSDVIDNLTSEDIDKPVSAKQAKNLKNMIDALDIEIDRKTNDLQVEQKLATKINISEKGVKNGVATLGDDGKVLASQLPISVVDQIVELVDYCANAPSVGDKGTRYYNSIDKKIYISNGTAWISGESPLTSKIYLVKGGNEVGKQYRWSGSEFINTNSAIVLGETSANAYPGDKGKLAYEHSLRTSGNPHGVTKEDVGLGNVENTKDENKKVLSAKTLTNSVKINGVPFNGSQDIEILDNTKIPLLAEPLIVNEKLNIFYDSYGRVTGGRELQDKDIPTTIKERISSLEVKEPELRVAIDKKLNKNLGLANAGKMLVVNNNGEVDFSDTPEGTDIVADIDTLATYNDDVLLKSKPSSAYLSKEIIGRVNNINTDLEETNENLNETKTELTAKINEDLEQLNMGLITEINKKISYEESVVVDSSINPLSDYYNKTEIHNIISNPNFIVNGDFRVNQRNFSSTKQGRTYTVDRWRTGGQLTNANTVEVTLNEDGSMTITNINSSTSSSAYFVQTLEASDADKLNGKTVTLSCCDSDGNIYIKTGIFTKGSNNSSPTGATSFGYFRIMHYTNGTSEVTIQVLYGKSVTLKWVKLEIGSVATSFSPRPYVEELALCQRYYEKLSLRGTVGYGFATAGNGGFALKLLSKMRTKPTITVPSMPYVRGYGNNIQATSIEVESINNNDTLLLSTQATCLTTNNMFVFASGEIEVDAEL